RIGFAARPLTRRGPPSAPGSKGTRAGLARTPGRGGPAGDGRVPEPVARTDGRRVVSDIRERWYRAVLRLLPPATGHSVRGRWWRSRRPRTHARRAPGGGP